jgi:DNA-binding response OmpR family regulator/HPt (histidine-containing phosphotransfer) domain-containing protein
MLDKPDDILKPLRGLYLAQLRERATTVDTFLTHCRAGTVPPGERAVMMSLAHKLAGSGTTYGYPLITQSARALEQALSESEDAVPTAGLVVFVESLAHACAQALLAIERDSHDVSVRAAPPPSHEKPLLLAVDDDPVVRETLVVLFGRDFEVVTAPDGAEAFKLFVDRPPRLVLVDQTMPNMNGLEFVTALRRSGEAGRDTPVIMITAKGQSQDVVAALGAGVSDYIVKPFETKELAAKVRELLHRSGRTVLIADDDPAIRDLLAYKFRLAGVRCLTASDGEEAWRLCEEYRPQLAVLDRMMPGLDGVAVLKKMREHAGTRDIPVMFLTALRQEKDILEGFRLGVSDYVVKPFLPEEVLARGLRLLGIDAAGSGAAAGGVR